jgi:hypothetical protein
MTDYTPDRWCVVSFVNRGERFNKVLAEWKGGYLDGDHWRMNSGITAVEEAGDYYDFHGASGSIYHCHKSRYGVTGEAHRVLQALLDRNSDDVIIRALPEHEDWTGLDMVERR